LTKIMILDRFLYNGTRISPEDTAFASNFDSRVIKVIDMDYRDDSYERDNIGLLDIIIVNAGGAAQNQ